MTNRRKMVAIVLAAACLLLATEAWAGARPRPKPNVDPERIAAKCVQRAKAVAAHCDVVNQRVVDACVAKIDELLAQGLVEQAEARAKRGIHRVNRVSIMCARVIRRNCQACVRVLIILDRPDLARRVKAACEKEVEAVRQSRVDAVAAIEGALPPQ